MTFESARPVAKKLIDFINQSRSPYHAVNTVRSQLLQRGYVHLDERTAWEKVLKPNGKYFFTRNQSSIIVLAVGGKYQVGNGWKIIGAHTDSPDLKLKPISKQSKVGYLQVGVQTYGSGLWYTWFDRDLTIAGRVLVESEDKNTTTHRFEHKLVEIDSPILRIPSLAIHLNREVRDGFKFNDETHLLPIISTVVDEQLNQKSTDVSEQQQPQQQQHHSILLNLIAEKLNCSVDKIRDVDLSIVDYQPATIGGAQQEFIFAPRLDNLLSCFCSIEALFNEEETLSEETDIRMVALFDNEEVGSTSNQGAASAVLKDTITRVTKVFSSTTSTSQVPVDSYEMAIAKSFLISADMAHAVHPNYSDKHQECHRPMIHKGLVIKVNANQRYATTAHSSRLLQELAKTGNVPIQQFVVRNDSLCGSTIGPIISANLGIRTVDIGVPQLSMHSIREMCGVVDPGHAVNLFKQYFSPAFRQLDQSIQMD